MKITRDMLTPGVLARFWAKVDKNGPIPSHRPELGPCWIWKAATCRGYGKFRIGIKGPGTLFISTHISYAIKHGVMPENLFALHHCDNPACINPDHIFLGRDAENMKDKSLKGRAVAGYCPPEKKARGEVHPKHKLTELSIREIRRLCSIGIPQRKIAAMFGVSKPQISYIKNRITWRHVQ